MENTLEECVRKLFENTQGTQDNEVNIPTEDKLLESSYYVSDQNKGEMETILKNIVNLYDSYKKYNAQNDYENAGKVMRDIDIYLARANELFEKQE